MKSNVFWGVVILGGISLAIYAGCDSPPPRVLQVKYDPSGSASRAMDKFDTNKDKKISGDELLKAPGLRAALPILGTDKDKGVTAELIKKRVQSWIDSQVGRQTINCTFYRGNEPLADADIKFVPEAFLADDFKDREGKPLIGVGKTSSAGMAMITWPTTRGEDGDPPGMGPGIYRIEVTKAGTTVPAKYNTATELGQELSTDNPELQKGLKYILKF
jgi:hypothetical protein